MIQERPPGVMSEIVEAEPPIRPRTLAEAKLAVENSRKRIAATLDELEGRIVDTRDKIKRKVDVVQPARKAIQRTPLIALGVAVAVGILLGTRGGREDEDEDEFGFDKAERKALDEWRTRRRKMLMSEAEVAAEVFDDEPEERGIVSRFISTVGHDMAGVVVGIVAAEVAERMFGARSHDEDEDDEFEDGIDHGFDTDDEDDEILADPEAEEFDESTIYDDD